MPHAPAPPPEPWIRIRRRARAGVAVLLVLASLACAREESPEDPVLLIGIDGLEWRILLPLLADGQLPAFRDLMQRGTFGRLATFQPTYSPVLWTTAATGKLPHAHGIPHFVRRGANGLALYTSVDRRTKAVWNILSDAGDTVHTVGWWMTYPVEPVRGSMVAQTNTASQVDTRYGRNIWKGGVLEGVPDQTWPAALQEPLLALTRQVQAELPEIAAERFGTLTPPLALLEQRLWQNTLWSLRADAIYLRWTRALLERGEPFDVLLVYFGLPDVVGHRFYRYWQPELYAHPPPPEAIANFGDAIPAAYRWADHAVGRLLEAAPENTTVLLVSDHGMVPGNRDQPFPADAPPSSVNSGLHLEAPPGVLLAAGPRVARGPLADRDPAALRYEDLPQLGSLADVAPTVLALRGHPVGRDMAGRALDALFTEGFRARHPTRFVETHDRPGWRAALREAVATRAHAPEVEAERIEQLRELGYLDE